MNTSRVFGYGGYETAIRWLGKTHGEHYTQKVGRLQMGTRTAPRDRYQVMNAILGKAGAPLVELLWKTIHQEEHQLWPIWPTEKYTP